MPKGELDENTLDPLKSLQNTFFRKVNFFFENRKLGRNAHMRGLAVECSKAQLVP